MNLNDILVLYPEYTVVLGPYLRKDGRKHIVLNNSYAPKFTKGKTKTISYPKVLMEIKLGRRLLENETVDHIDEDISNDRYSNLQILTRQQNAAKSNILRPRSPIGRRHET